MVQKLIIGLTGGFGTGKSTVSKIFRECGAAVIDADKIAHMALKKNSPLFKKVKNLFPEALAHCGRHFRREKIAEKIFSNSRKRERLEAIVHPYVLREMKKKIMKTSQEIIVAEIPLLFETGFNSFCDKTIAVVCDPIVKRKRLGGKGFDLKEIKAREKAQMSESLKSKKADFVIRNSNTISKTRKETKRLWERLVLLAKRRAL